MIILSGVLVVVAIALLVAGIVAGEGDSAEVFDLEALSVIYISIAVSIVSALCLAVGVFLRRKELFGPGVATAPARQGQKAAKKDRKAKRAKGTQPMPAASGAGAVPGAKPAAAAGPADEVAIPAPPVDVPGDALVFVVRGRKRYHLDTCRQLAGREKEELTYAEAKEEGFSPCTACMPDTALAARAAASGPASPDAGKTAGAAPTPPKPGAERSGSGPAGLGKPELGKPPAAPHSAPTPFDTTAELPRTDKPAAPEAKAPAAPTLTDMPVSAPLAPEPAAGPAEKTEPGGPKPDDASAADRPAGSESAPDAAAPKPRGAQAGDEPAGDGPPVRILSGTKRYHRVDCALIEDIGDETDDLEALSRAEAKSRGCTPCLVCEPDREHARD
ncbi:hypothetical protein OHR68_22510 [Spirillospora sp. NBC_00431]